MKTIQLYSASGVLLGRISVRELARMQECGMILHTSKNRMGEIKRAVRLSRAGEGSVHTLSSLSGTKYSYQEQFDSGCRAWSLMEMEELQKHQGIMHGRPSSVLAPPLPKQAALSCA